MNKAVRKGYEKFNDSLTILEMSLSQPVFSEETPTGDRLEGTMALSLGSISNFFTRSRDAFSNPSNPNQQAATGTNASNYDGAKFSEEMMGGMQNPLVESIAQTVQQIQLAQSFGGDPSTSLQQLQQEVQDAQMQGVSLPPGCNKPWKKFWRRPA